MDKTQLIVEIKQLCEKIHSSNPNINSSSFHALTRDLYEKATLLRYINNLNLVTSSSQESDDSKESLDDIIENYKEETTFIPLGNENIDENAFIVYLFENNAEEYYHILSRVCSLSSRNEAIAFIEQAIKPDYNWYGKEEHEESFKAFVLSQFDN